MKTRASASPVASSGTPTPDGAAVPQAVGMIMATTPCTAREAERVLATAAERAGTTVAKLAAAMVAERRGRPLPAPVDRALGQATRAARRSARTPSGRKGPRLLPTTSDAEKVLGEFFDARVRLLAAPADEAARRALEDAVYTLCVLMAEPTAYGAVVAAVQYTDG